MITAVHPSCFLLHVTLCLSLSSLTNPIKPNSHSHLVTVYLTSLSPPPPPPPSMASLALFSKLTLVVSLMMFLSLSGAEMDKTSMKLMSDALEWPSTMSLYDELEEAGEDAMDDGFSRRSLYWHRMRYYISYGALSANRIPCPPRSGRSYYTHNCFKARGPVHPYSRGCSAITRCRR